MSKELDEIAVVIQARLGSQRVPQKMARPFAGTTLLDIALQKITRSTVIRPANFYLSVYEDELKEIGRKHGVQLFERSERSALSEGTPMTDMYEWWDKIPHRYAVLVNGCAPMLTTETIDAFVQAYAESPHDGLFGVIPKKNYFWNEGGELVTEWPEGQAVMNTKVVGVTYEAAHCLYGGRLDLIGKGIWMGDFQSPNSPALFEMREEEVFDVDYEWEFRAYEAIYASQHKEKQLV